MVKRVLARNFVPKKGLGAIFYQSYTVTWGSLAHIRRLWRRFGAHSSSVVHISVLKRLFGAHFGTKKGSGAHFEVKKGSWCTILGLKSLVDAHLVKAPIL